MRRYLGFGCKKMQKVKKKENIEHEAVFAARISVMYQSHMCWLITKYDFSFK